MSVDIKQIKDRIAEYVNAYRSTYPDEYKAAVKQVKENRSKNLSDTGDIKKSGAAIDTIDRPIHEIPQTLFTIFMLRLTEEEHQWFNTNTGARWFAKTYPEFSRVERV